MSSGYDMRVKVWDLRNSELPVHVMQNSHYQVECAKYNPYYD